MTAAIYVNLDEIVVTPRIIVAGDISLDTTKLDAFNSFRLLKFYNEEKGIISNPDEALELITDMVNSQRDDKLEPTEVLKRIGTNTKVIALQLAVTDEILRTYRLTRGEDSPLDAILKVIRPDPPKSISTE